MVGSYGIWYCLHLQRCLNTSLRHDKSDLQIFMWVPVHICGPRIDPWRICDGFIFVEENSLVLLTLCVHPDLEQAMTEHRWSRHEPAPAAVSPCSGRGFVLACTHPAGRGKLRGWPRLQGKPAENRRKVLPERQGPQRTVDLHVR